MVDKEKRQKMCGAKDKHVATLLAHIYVCLCLQLMGVCYKKDAMNAMGLVERRNAKWDEMDCLELALMGKDMMFVSTPAAQASIELSWRRGMNRCPSLAVILANVCPFLIFLPKLFR